MARWRQPPHLLDRALPASGGGGLQRSGGTQPADAAGTGRGGARARRL